MLFYLQSDIYILCLNIFISQKNCYNFVYSRNDVFILYIIS